MPELQFSLGRGERLIWSGAPCQGFVLRPRDAFEIPFSLLWAGFVVFWNASVWRMGAPLLFRLFGLPFLIMGVYITVGRFWVDARTRARTTYALTTERVIVASGLLRPTVRSLDLATLTNITLTERPDGSGTVTFGPETLGRGVFGFMNERHLPKPPSFEFIADAKRVYDAVRAAQRAGSGATQS